MKLIHLFPLSLIILVTACEKNTVGYSDEPFPDIALYYGPPVTAPCSPDTNTSIYNGQTVHYVASDDFDPNYYQEADWGIDVHTTNFLQHLRVDFQKKPDSGKYLTRNTGQLLEENECIVSGSWTLGSTTKPFRATPGDTVYVNNLGFGKFSITFCNLHFVQSNVGTEEFYTSANLTKL